MLADMEETTTTHLRRAVELAEESVANGGGPFGAVLVLPDGRTFEAANRVTLDNDPTAHAEVVAIRRACRELGVFDLGGATLYASCEPCPMCLAASLWARVGRVFFAADRFAADRAGFSDAEFYDYLEGRSGPELMPVERLAIPEAEKPFEVWARSEQRVEY